MIIPGGNWGEPSGGATARMGSGSLAAAFRAFRAFEAFEDMCCPLLRRATHAVRPFMAQYQLPLLCQWMNSVRELCVNPLQKRAKWCYSPVLLCQCFQLVSLLTVRLVERKRPFKQRVPGSSPGALTKNYAVGAGGFIKLSWVKTHFQAPSFQTHVSVSRSNTSNGFPPNTPARSSLNVINATFP